MAGGDTSGTGHTPRPTRRPALRTAGAARSQDTSTGWYRPPTSSYYSPAPSAWPARSQLVERREGEGVIND